LKNEIAILSGKGGTGKTSLSAAYATLNGRVMLVDCDVDAANLHLVLQPKNYIEEKFITGYKATIDYNMCTQCGICVDYCRFDAISDIDGKVSISETQCDGCKLCSRICPAGAISMIVCDESYWYAGNFRNGKMVYARLAPGEENSGKLVNAVREYARKAAEEFGFDTIIIDGPPGIGCPAISSVTGVDKVIIITEPTLSGFHDMKRILELTEGFSIKSYVIINKYDLNAAITEQIIDWCSRRKINVAGKLPFDEKIVEAMIRCKSIVEYMPDSQVSNEIRNSWKIINAEGS